MLEIHRLSALKDNYVFVIRDTDQNLTAVVDPSEAAVVEKFLAEKQWSLQLILNTHHHHDHVGGNLELKKRFDCPIYCSAFDLARVPGASHPLKEGDRVEFGQHVFEVLEVPGHTLGAIAYHEASEGLVFTGDTLFTVGCGRIFEGTADQLWRSLNHLAALPETTKVYSGHEYGLQNAAFALSLNPESAEWLTYLKEVKVASETGRGTVPSTLAQEKRLNPFLKARDAADFARLRRLKDEFRLEEGPSLR